MSAIFSWSALAQAKHQAELCWVGSGQYLVVTGVTGLVGSNTCAGPAGDQAQS